MRDLPPSERVVSSVTSDVAVVPQNTPSVVSFGPRRKLVAYLAIGVVVGGQVYDLVFDREHWPFSPYPMYSYVMGERVSVYRLMGVEDDGGEFPLLNSRYLRPLNWLGMAGALSRLDRKPDRERLLGEALGDCLARYERRRVAGEHDGPPLRAIRLYRLSWTMNPSASNRDRPDRRELLFEGTARADESR